MNAPSSVKASAATRGYAIGLSPASRTPVALQFMVDGKVTSPVPIVLKPGQTIRLFEMGDDEMTILPLPPEGGSR